MSEKARAKVISVIPELQKPKSSVQRNSTGKTCTRASPSCLDGDQKRIPHYLRTSTGSCHDFCKYGMKRDLEVKKKHPVSRRSLANKKMPDDENNQANVVTKRERKKKPNLKLEVSQEKKEVTEKPTSIEQNDLPPEKIIELSDSPTNLAEGSAQESSNMKFKFLSIDQKSDSFLKQSYANQAERSSEESISIKLMIPSTILTSNKSDEHESSNPSDGSSENPVNIKLDQKANQNGDGSSELALTEGSFAEPVIVKLMISSPMQRNSASLSTTSSIGSPAYQEEGLSKTGRQVTNSSTGRGKKIIGVSDRPKVIRQAKIDLSGEPNDGMEKTAPSVRKAISSAKPETKQRSSSSIDRNIASVTSRMTLSGGLARRNHEKVIKVSGQSDSGEEKVLGKSSLPMSMKPRISRVSSAKLQIFQNVAPASQVKNQAKDGKLVHKKEILNVREPAPERINVKTRKQNPRKHKSPLSDGKDHDSGSKLGEASESVLPEKVTRRISGVVSDGEIDTKARRTASVHLEDKFPIAHKLNFSRGNIVSMQHENNAPRILRIRSAKTASDNQNAVGDVGTKGLRNMTTPSGADPNTPTSESPTVVLRHQDVQEKKDAQGLLNQVLEETASKLVETRKSKVKALVGAFETVISLQESKESPPAVL